MVLLRKVIGDALRARRLAQRRTLREVSTAANVSLGYLSEIERGHKEASSELLASICEALGAPLSQMLGDVSATFALAEQMEFAVPRTDADREAAQPVALASGGLRRRAVPLDGAALDEAVAALDPAILDGAGLDLDPAILEGVGLDRALGDGLVAVGDGLLERAVNDGDVTVQVHSDGPLRTTLITKRVPPGQRFTEKIYVG